MSFDNYQMILAAISGLGRSETSAAQGKADAAVSVRQEPAPTVQGPSGQRPRRTSASANPNQESAGEGQPCAGHVTAGGSCWAKLTGGQRMPTAQEAEHTRQCFQRYKTAA